MDEIQQIARKMNNLQRDFTVACDPIAFENLLTTAQQKHMLSVGENHTYYVDFPGDKHVRFFLVEKKPGPYEECELYLRDPERLN